MSLFNENPQLIFDNIKELLNLAVKDRHHSFHIPVFICGSNENISGRIVVLRGVNENDRKIWFHSDIRSNKIKSLKSNPNGTLLFYDKAEKIQLRIFSKIIINYKNQFTKLSWKNTAHMSRQCYLGDNAPGFESYSATSGLTKDIDNFLLSFGPK